MGFVISKLFNNYVSGFCPVNERIASLKIKCRGEVFAIVTVLAADINLRLQREKW